MITSTLSIQNAFEEYLVKQENAHKTLNSTQNYIYSMIKICFKNEDSSVCQT